MMPVALLAFVLSVLGPGPDAWAIARAIVDAAALDAGQAPLTGSHAEDAAMLAVFARRESGASRRPRAQSWDARAAVSCGVWQMPCAVERRLTLTEQATAWLRWARQGGVAGLCGYGRAAQDIARARQAEAHAALTRAVAP